MNSLYDKLVEYGEGDFIPMHMPGHKRNIEKFPYIHAGQIDITEIDGFDDYHYPQGIIDEMQMHAAKVYGTKYSFYLINGSSCGILTAISAVLNRGDSVIVARNCHKSVYNGMFMNDLVPQYIYPETDSRYNIMTHITPECVREAFRQCDARAVIITSPTYEGVVSDVKSIAQICHENGAILIVDEAHGAHFCFGNNAPDTAMKCGADIVIESVHKTLPSYTQTAVMHICSDRVDIGRVRRYLSVYQTSSPSYVFMSGIQKCIEYMESDVGREAYKEYENNLANLRKSLLELKNIKLVTYDKENENVFAYDTSKIVLFCRNGGAYLYDEMLSKYHIQLEMAAKDYVIAMTSVGDKKEWYDCFIKAVKEIDKSMAENASKDENDACGSIIKADVVCTLWEAFGKEYEYRDIDDAAGKISADWVYAYPPGIPIICPGERVTCRIIEYMKEQKSRGVALKGFQDGRGDKILCIK